MTQVGFRTIDTVTPVENGYTHVTFGGYPADRYTALVWDPQPELNRRDIVYLGNGLQIERHSPLRTIFPDGKINAAAPATGFGVVVGQWNIELKDSADQVFRKLYLYDHLRSINHLPYTKQEKKEEPRSEFVRGVSKSTGTLDRPGIMRELLDFGTYLEETVPVPNGIPYSNLPATFGEFDLDEYPWSLHYSSYLTKFLVSAARYDGKDGKTVVYALGDYSSATPQPLVDFIKGEHEWGDLLRDIVLAHPEYAFVVGLNSSVKANGGPVYMVEYAFKIGTKKTYNGDYLKEQVFKKGGWKYQKHIEIATPIRVLHSEANANRWLREILAHPTEPIPAEILKIAKGSNGGLMPLACGLAVAHQGLNLPDDDLPRAIVVRQHIHKRRMEDFKYPGFKIPAPYKGMQVHRKLTEGN